MIRYDRTAPGLAHCQCLGSIALFSVAISDSQHFATHYKWPGNLAFEVVLRVVRIQALDKQIYHVGVAVSGSVSDMPGARHAQARHARGGCSNRTQLRRNQTHRIPKPRQCPGIEMRIVGQDGLAAGGFSTITGPGIAPHGNARQPITGQVGRVDRQAE